MIEKLKTGDFNYMEQQAKPDGSVIITLFKSGDPKAYRFRVKDLYGEHEKVLWEKIIEGKE